MLKTVKNGSGIRVDPPLFFQNSHIFPFFWGGSVPKMFVSTGWNQLFILLQIWAGLRKLFLVDVEKLPRRCNKLLSPPSALSHRIIELLTCIVALLLFCRML